MATSLLTFRNRPVINKPVLLRCVIIAIITACDHSTVDVIFVVGCQHRNNRSIINMVVNQLVNLDCHIYLFVHMLVSVNEVKVFVTCGQCSHYYKLLYTIVVP